MQFRFIDNEMKKVFDDMNKIIIDAQSKNHDVDFIEESSILNLLLECQTCLFKLQDQLLVFESLHDQLKEKKNHMF